MTCNQNDNRTIETDQNKVSDKTADPTEVQSTEVQSTETSILFNIKNSLYPIYSYKNIKNVKFIKKLICRCALIDTSSTLKPNNDNYILYSFYIPTDTEEIQCVIGYTTDFMEVRKKLKMYNQIALIKFSYFTIIKNAPSLDTLFSMLKLEFDHLLFEEMENFENAFIFYFNPILFYKMTQFQNKYCQIIECDKTRKIVENLCVNAIENFKQNIV